MKSQKETSQNYVKIENLSKEEKEKMYSKLKKKDLIAMIISCNEVLESFYNSQKFTKYDETLLVGGSEISGQFMDTVVSLSKKIEIIKKLAKCKCPKKL